MNGKVLVLVVFILLLLFGSYYVVTNPTIMMQKEHVSNVFIDVNGDGMLDLLVSGDVILNNGTANFPIQPTNNQP